MLPLTLDREILESLPLPDEGASRVLADILDAVVARRVLPYFRKRMTDAVRLARVSERYGLARLEDPRREIDVATVVTRDPDGWTIHVHERFFDYLAFMVPGDLSLKFADATEDQRGALALAEMVLRHELEHMLYPDREEPDVLESDVVFMVDRQENDPTYFRGLRQALTSSSSGVSGRAYVELLDAAPGRPLDPELADPIVAQLACGAASLPADVLVRAAPVMGTRFLRSVIMAGFQEVRSGTGPVAGRWRRLQAVVRLLAGLKGRDAETAQGAIGALVERFGAAAVLEELEATGEERVLPDRALEVVGRRVQEMAAAAAVASAAPVAPQRLGPRESAAPSLKDRIETARTDPSLPPAVIALIDRNRGALHGGSGAKYTELVETLLSIPWGQLRRIEVTPGEFVAGLEQSHYGLARPKEILADFFTNLIWRYRKYSEATAGSWRRTGSAFLFVGPPGVGKTSLAISVATSLGIPFHKVSLGGMRDETDLRGHGFTYEGSKPGAILQGLIRMEVLNGMFILDEADKTEPFAVATLLEILDPEQNHLFHDKYITTSVDIDLSNCHFVLTANTLETVPPPVADRCEIVQLDRYSVDEKVEIAERFLLPRLRERYDVEAAKLDFPPEEREELLRTVVTTYTHEAGVRQLERTLRTLFLRLHRTEVLAGKGPVILTHDVIKRTLDEPVQPRGVAPEDRVGEMTALGVNVERGVGSIIPIQATFVAGGTGGEQRGPLSVVHATGNIEKVMDESRTVALTAILHSARELGIDPAHLDRPVHLHFLGASSRKDGPSAGGAIALALASLLGGIEVRRDVAMTGEIDTQGRITRIGGLDVKLETAVEAGCTTVIIPVENLHGEAGIDRFPEALKKELQVLTYAEWKAAHRPFDHREQLLQVVAVEHVLQAADVAFIEPDQIQRVEDDVAAGARSAAMELVAGTPGRSVQLVYVKEADEMDADFPSGPFCEGCDRCRLLTLAEAVPDVDRTDGGRNLVALADGADVVTVIEEQLRACQEASREGVATLVGPFFWLRSLELPHHLRDQLCLVATNYTAQGIKLKGAKPEMTRAACYLSRLTPETLEACAFATKVDGVIVADLSFIPERYRLDRLRAEKLLRRYVGRWLTEVESAAEASRRASPPAPPTP